ncbi:ATP-binding cassette domain-containing protein [SAR202 cluster bacterium AD-804-J14_MRT_500m]|nr:ATP-binding cassette domain-containing protein [SAR202 cluster bacterium AD-804-J14_MRT_500m]
MPGISLVEVKDLKMHFPVNSGIIFQRPKGWIKAVDGVSFSLHGGETLGLVGESGSGKTTVGRCILRLCQPVSGKIYFDGQDINAMNAKSIRKMRRRMQVIFQDPYSSLNPRMTAGSIIAEPLVIHKMINGKNELRNRVMELADLVGFQTSMVNRFPHEFSSGQRQRIAIARALALEPDFIVADEPVSALDVSIQAQIINLMRDLQDRLNLTYLFIAHDLSVVRHISDRVAVMYLGRIVELADKDELYGNPQHPYTKALLSAVPVPDPEIEAGRDRIILKGETPSPFNPPVGCPFHPRCPVAVQQCNQKIPDLQEVTPGHWVSCMRTPGYDSERLPFSSGPNPLSTP